jgi:hypothetical protein
MGMFGSHKAKSNGGKSHTADKRGPKVVPNYIKQDQSLWRIGCLLDRSNRNLFTAKNMKEIEALRTTSIEAMKLYNKVNLLFEYAVG